MVISIFKKKKKDTTEDKVKNFEIRLVQTLLGFMLNYEKITETLQGILWGFTTEEERKHYKEDKDFLSQLDKLNKTLNSIESTKNLIIKSQKVSSEIKIQLQSILNKNLSLTQILEYHVILKQIGILSKTTHDNVKEITEILNLLKNKKLLQKHESKVA